MIQSAKTSVRITQTVRVVTVMAVYQSRSKSHETQTRRYKNTKTCRKKRNNKKSKIEHTRIKQITNKRKNILKNKTSISIRRHKDTNSCKKMRRSTSTRISRNMN